ncbi:MAG: cytochrome c family protein [Cypionkella sp.]|nr:cytochrome c family protein [Cypionkella sp.]
MFDTMTLTKVTAAVCGSLLFYLMGGWAADTLYSTGVPSHGGEEVAQAYTIDTGEAAPVEAAEEGPDFATVLASADAAAGEKVFSKCKACHKLDGSDGTGPHLNGIVGKAKAASAGFAYSEGLVAMAADVWSPENLNAFLTNPKAYVAGTKMSFAGLPKVDDRANLIAYLAATQ